MGPLDQHILDEDALTATSNGLQLKFKSHWYRALPLSCMEFSLKINGYPIDEALTEIEINGKRFPKNRMSELKEEWLFILDRAIVHAPLNEPPIPGEKYEVEFGLDLYIPYILVGPESKPLLAGTTVIKQLTCK